MKIKEKDEISADYSLLQDIAVPLLEWYTSNARKLPWREDASAYHVWVSEIMLQQTRVEAVKRYYERFLTRLPSVSDLAQADEDILLKLWEGLGYYSRVRNMQKAAKVIMQEYAGSMPPDYLLIRKLPGIGSYTAGAISSIAFGIPKPAVDGNVLRVITRLTEDTSDIMQPSVKKRIEDALENIIPSQHAGDFNQSLIELGAIVCVPNNDPHCEVCPLKNICRSHASGKWTEIPVKKKAKTRKIEDRTVFVIVSDEQVLLNRRPDKGLLAGMYEFPNTDGHLSQDDAVAFVKGKGLDPIHIRSLPEAKHIFSHIEWHMKGYMVRVSDTDIINGYIFAEKKEMEEKYSIPSAFSAYTKYYKERF